MESQTEKFLQQLTRQFLIRNYDYVWLRSMLEKAAAVTDPGATLITGSSHALNGICEHMWDYAVNCSMHSQDLYYDFQCARYVLEHAGEGRFRKCLIVLGYYIAYQDLSLSKVSRESMIAGVYYPVLGDAHNWLTPVRKNLWGWIETEIPDLVKKVCEEEAVQRVRQQGTYYGKLRSRGTVVDLKNRAWSQVSGEERLMFGRLRAQAHNGIFAHKESFQENREIVREFVRFLYKYRVQPVVVIPPFTEEYNRFVLPEMKQGILELLEPIPEKIDYIDFNEMEGLFGPDDFMDTDHLGEIGAWKMSRVLVELFGP